MSGYVGHLIFVAHALLCDLILLSCFYLLPQYAVCPPLKVIPPVRPYPESHKGYHYYCGLLPGRSTPPSDQISLSVDCQNEVARISFQFDGSSNLWNSYRLSHRNVLAQYNLFRFCGRFLVLFFGLFILLAFESPEGVSCTVP